MSEIRCIVPGCGASTGSAFPVCVAHFFNVPAPTRHAYFEALEARARATPRDRAAAEDRYRAAYEAVVALAAPNGRPAGPAVREMAATAGRAR